MEVLINPVLATGLDHPSLHTVPDPAFEGSAVMALLAQCPRAGVTPLIDARDLALQLGLGALHIKDERGRMGLGSFKALGAAHVIARHAQKGRAQGATYMAASAGNHGLSVAAGAAAFGARAVIYLSDTVPESFADRLRAQGAEVRRAGARYEDSMAAAARDADAEGAFLLSDSSWPGYFEAPHVLMEGYLALMEEVYDQIPHVPDLILLQAGVGGLAGAAAASARARWGATPRIAVVEPEAAPALQASIRAGAPVVADGPVSAMGRLDCKEPSLIALKGLSRDADLFVTLTEEEGAAGAQAVAEAGWPASPSGAAGIAALVAAQGDLRTALGVGPTTRAFAILSEGPA